MNELIKDLNNMQKEAVLTIDGPLLLLAGAGSGKTKVLTHRIAYLVEIGINPYNILAITFTNKACKEMKERIRSLIKEGDIWIGTFHSMCVRILRKYINNIDYKNNFTIYDSNDTERLIKDCLKELNLNEKLFQPKAVMNIISNLKDELKNEDDFKKEVMGDNIKIKYLEIYKLYQKKLKANNAVDFDDIIFKTVELFQKDNNILKKFQNRFKYIMVDEYQDTNTAQYTLIKLLASKYKNICVVGDDDQSIYGWRGANIKNIINFEVDFSETKIIKLEQNYRSTKNILDAANAIIKNNNGRKDKILWTENVIGNKIIYNRLLDDVDEANFIVSKIEDHLNEDYKYSDISILYRQNSLSRIIEEALIKNNIPYKLIGGVKFYDRKEIKDILSYLRIINNYTDDMALKRIINVPKRGIGNITLEKLSNYAALNNISIYETLDNINNISSLKNSLKNIEKFKILIEDMNNFSKNNKISDVIHKLLNGTGYITDIKNNSDIIEATSRLENIDSFINKAIDFETYSNDKSLGAFLEDVILLSDIDNIENDEDMLTLMTIHSAKGLEFPIVFLSAFEEGLFPTYRSILSNDKNDIQEERRLCYVAITRAKNQLYITSSKSRLQHGKIIYNNVSRFLKEIPISLIENLESEIKYKNKSLNQSILKKNKSEKKQIAFNSYKMNSTVSNKELDFVVGDKVRQIKYGIGIVKDINFAYADYEVTVDFENIGIKKLMANLSNIKKYKK